MNEQAKIQCPDCDELESVGRRDFLMAVGGTAVTLASLEVCSAKVWPRKRAEHPLPPPAPPSRRKRSFANSIRA